MAIKNIHVVHMKKPNASQKSTELFNKATKLKGVAINSKMLGIFPKKMAKILFMLIRCKSNVNKK